MKITKEEIKKRLGNAADVDHAKKILEGVNNNSHNYTPLEMYNIRTYALARIKILLDERIRLGMHRSNDTLTHLNN